MGKLILDGEDQSGVGVEVEYDELATAIITGATDLTSPAKDDSLLINDKSATATKEIELTNLWKVINLLTAETSPAKDDELALYDLSATATDKITLLNLLKVINVLTEDTTPADADFLVTYDASASAVKKVKKSNIAGGGGLWELGEHHEASITESTYTFTKTYDSDSYSAVIIFFELPMTADLNLEFKVNGITAGYYSIGHDLDHNGGTDTILKDANLAHHLLFSESALEADGIVFGYIIIQTNNAGVGGRAPSIESNCQESNNLNHENRTARIEAGTVDSITSIILETSTSTWKANGHITTFGIKTA